MKKDGASHRFNLELFARIVARERQSDLAQRLKSEQRNNGTREHKRESYYNTSHTACSLGETNVLGLSMTQTSDQIARGVFTCDKCGSEVKAVRQDLGHLCNGCSIKFYTAKDGKILPKWRRAFEDK